MFKRILVPLDGSILAEHALQPALALAQKGTDEIILLRVPVYKEAPAAVAAAYRLLQPEHTQERIRARAERYLKSMRQIKLELDVSLQLQVKDGDVASVIVDTAAEENIDLIVMSSHGRTGLTRWMLGSVTEKVLRGAPCPVLAVRSATLPGKILIALDGSTLAEKALLPGLEIARRLNSQVILLHVQEPIDTNDVLAELVAQDVEFSSQQLQETLSKQAESYLRNLAERHELYNDYFDYAQGFGSQHKFPNRLQAGASIQTAVKTGPVAHEILAFAEENLVDLIVMTTHGGTGLQRWAYGSITERILHGAKCALFVVPVPAQGLK